MQKCKDVKIEKQKQCCKNSRIPGCKDAGLAEFKIAKWQKYKHASMDRNGMQARKVEGMQKFKNVRINGGKYAHVQIIGLIQCGRL